MIHTSLEAHCIICTNMLHPPPLISGPASLTRRLVSRAFTRPAQFQEATLTSSHAGTNQPVYQGASCLRNPAPPLTTSLNSHPAPSHDLMPTQHRPSPDHSTTLPPNTPTPCTVPGSDLDVISSTHQPTSISRRQLSTHPPSTQTKSFKLNKPH